MTRRCARRYGHSHSSSPWAFPAPWAWPERRRHKGPVDGTSFRGTPLLVPGSAPPMTPVSPIAPRYRRWEISGERTTVSDAGRGGYGPWSASPVDAGGDSDGGVVRLVGVSATDSWASCMGPFALKGSI